MLQIIAGLKAGKTPEVISTELAIPIEEVLEVQALLG